MLLGSFSDHLVLLLNKFDLIYFISTERERKRSWYAIVAYPICRSVRELYCGKTADWVVSEVGRGMGVLDSGDDC